MHQYESYEMLMFWVCQSDMSVNIVFKKKNIRIKQVYGKNKPKEILNLEFCSWEKLFFTFLVK